MSLEIHVTYLQFFTMFLEECVAFLWTFVTIFPEICVNENFVTVFPEERVTYLRKVCYSIPRFTCNLVRKSCYSFHR
jgi:hypothetical protein